MAGGAPAPSAWPDSRNDAVVLHALGEVCGGQHRFLQAGTGPGRRAFDRFGATRKNHRDEDDQHMAPGHGVSLVAIEGSSGGPC